MSAMQAAISQDTGSLADQAYDLVERMIVTLELHPGSVFSENDLSERIGIGRTPLREALQRLAGDRLLVALPRRGMMVTDINVTEYLALLETRRILDRLIVARAAKRCSEEKRNELRRCAEELRGAAAREDLDAFMRLDRACDEILEAAAHNPFAVRAVAPLHAHCRRFWSMYRHSSDLGRSAELHALLLDAVADGDEKVAESASDRLIDYLERFTREAVELL